MNSPKCECWIPNAILCLVLVVFVLFWSTFNHFFFFYHIYPLLIYSLVLTKLHHWMRPHGGDWASYIDDISRPSPEAVEILHEELERAPAKLRQTSKICCLLKDLVATRNIRMLARRSNVPRDGTLTGVLFLETSQTAQQGGTGRRCFYYCRTEWVTLQSSWARQDSSGAGSSQSAVFSDHQSAGRRGKVNCDVVFVGVLQCFGVGCWRRRQFMKECSGDARASPRLGRCHRGGGERERIDGDKFQLFVFWLPQTAWRVRAGWRYKTAAARSTSTEPRWSRSAAPRLERPGEAPASAARSVSVNTNRCALELPHFTFFPTNTHMTWMPGYHLLKMLMKI